MKLAIAAIASVLLASTGAGLAQQAGAAQVTTPFTTCETNWSFFGQSKKETTCRTVQLDADRCRTFRDLRFIGWPAEGDALRKFQASGERSLTEDERKWLAAYRGRRAACEALLKRLGE